MKRKVMLTVFAAWVGVTGCSPIHEQIQAVREAKYAADTAFVAQYEATLAIADSGWTKKHEIQKLIIERTYRDWMLKNGAQFDDRGNVVGGTIPWVHMLAQQKQLESEYAKLNQSIATWNAAKTLAQNAVASYRQTNAVTYASEKEAMEAEKSAQAALTAILEALAGFTGGMLAGAAL